MSEARLDALARPDKWYLGAGDGIVWAPPFPEHLDRPGFWDPAHLFHFPVAPLFTVALVDPAGRQIDLAPRSRRWRPDGLKIRWSVADTPRVVLVERRFVLPGARFVSHWTVEGDGALPSGTELVAFTQVPEAELVDEPTVTAPGGDARDKGAGGGRSPSRGALRWKRTLRHHDVTAAFDFRLDAGPGVRAMAVGSQGRPSPEWRMTPFEELWSAGEEPAGRGGASPAPETGWLHLAVGGSLRPGASGMARTFVLDVGTPGFLSAPATDASAGAVPLDPALPWSSHFDRWPRFRCSDPYLERYFDYRVYGLFLNRVGPGPRGYPHPAVAEGIEYFHWPIAYSAPCHMRETRWATDPAEARGSLLNFLEAQREDGSLPGRLHVGDRDGPPEPDFYHADWGGAVLAVDALHPDTGFLRRAYSGLSRYARWLLRERDPEGSGMITVVNHYETGQEYMSRYLAVDPASDTTEWEPRLELKGIDVTVYAYRLLRALATMERRLGEADSGGERRPADEFVSDRTGDGTAPWDELARRTARALLHDMWDDEAGLFSDVDGRSGERTGVKAAVCFYPLMTDLLEDRHVHRLLEHLTDPASFATPWPVPSSSVDDPLFDARGLWKGRRHNCPWNGRVWPMTNSHVIEGLLNQWRRGRRATGPVAAHLLDRFVHMMFDGGRVDRPNGFEHYNPFTAHPSRFRGIDDYQHSWVVDLLIRGAAGLHVEAEGLCVDPLPMELDGVSLTGCRVRGREVSVRIRGDSVELRVDGSEHRGRVGRPLEVPW